MINKGHCEALKHYVFQLSKLQIYIAHIDLGNFNSQLFLVRNKLVDSLIENKGLIA